MKQVMLSFESYKKSTFINKGIKKKGAVYYEKGKAGTLTNALRSSK